MTDLRIRNIEPWVIESIRALAKAHGRTMEAELRATLEEAVSRSKQELLNELQGLQKDLTDKYALLSDSTAFIREERDLEG